jgi:hypothetical protein
MKENCVGGGGMIRKMCTWEREGSGGMDLN